MKPLSAAILFVAIICSTSIGMGQNEKPTPTPSPTPQAQVTAPAAVAANHADVASMDSIIAALYDVISGPAGKKRDWDRMRSLFVPGARLIPTGPRQGGGYGSRVLTVDDYIERSSPFFEKEGFYESETSRVTEQFGQIAHAFSTYDSKHAPGDAKPFARGINSIQLMNDGSVGGSLPSFGRARTRRIRCRKNISRSRKGIPASRRSLRSLCGTN